MRAAAGKRAEEPPAILLYDGYCGFCSRSVLFLYHRDPEGHLRFASLQSAVGQRLLAENGLTGERSTVVLLDAAGAHVRSTAILRAVRRLRGPWSWAYGAIVVPRFLRDGVYQLVARNRHRFGRAVAACSRPEPALRARMLDQE